MAGIPTFGAGSTLGPLGNAGPSTSSSTSNFSPLFGEVQFGGGSGTVSAVVPWIIAGTVTLAGLATWYLLQK